MLALVAGSGVASLIYQVVWVRRLVLVYGSTTLATSTVLVTFLGGLAIGAWLWGKIADRHTQWGMALFGLVEAATGLYGFASIWLLRAVEVVYARLYPIVEGAGGVGGGVQFVLSSIVIAPAAVLMGGTVPLLARAASVGKTSPAGPAGALYGWNTVGAACGAALATYGLLPVLGLRGAVTLAAVGNLLVAALALLADAAIRRSALPPAKTPDVFSNRERDEGSLDGTRRLIVLQALALSGLAAMIYEVTWARILALMVGSSVYAFGALLVVVLAGLGIGSALYARRRADAAGHVRAFGVLELLIGLSSLLSLIAVPALPEIVVRLHPVVRDAFGLQIAEHLGIAGALALVPALLFGATFPAAVGSLGGLQRIGRAIGRTYAANTVGSVAGAYLAGFMLIPALGLRTAIILGVVANLVAGASLLLSGAGRRTGRVAAVAAAAAAAMAMMIAPAWSKEALVAGGALAAAHHGSVAGLRAQTAARRLLFYQDGISATLSVEQAGTYRILRINGRTNASTAPADMLVQVLPAHLPMLWHPSPRRVFIIGLGSGITAGVVARYPVERLDVAELEPAGPRAARLFDAENQRVLSDRRVRVHPTDARARLQGSPDRYDVIISIPSHLWVAGTATLYTREFYQTAAARLEGDGVFVQWVQKAGLDPQAFRLVVATFMRSFPHTTVWSAGPTHAVLFGTRSAQRWALDRLRSRMAETPGAADDLRRIGIWHPLAVFGAFVLGEEDVVRFAGGVRRPLSDDWPVIEFSAPRSVFDDTAPAITAGLEEVRRSLLPPIDGFDPQRGLDARAAYLLGFAYASLGRTSLAISTMEAAVRAAPKVAPYHVGLANQYLQAGRRREARQAYEAALRVDPGHSEALLALGTMNAQEGDADTALQYYRRAVDAAPDLVEARILLANALLQRGQARAAVPHLEHALSRSRDNPELIERLGKALLAAGQPDGALRHLSAAVGRYPQHAPLHRALGEAWLAASRPDLAVEALARAAALNPDAAGYAALGRALLANGRPREAADAARRALAIDPFSPAALDVLERARAALRGSR